jgi:hypothetical protein
MAFAKDTIQNAAAELNASSGMSGVRISIDVDPN